MPITRCQKILSVALRAALIFALAGTAARSQTVPRNTSIASRVQTPRTKIIIDTDIGDDVDDAFAVGLALTSPELQILGITTAWGDTQLRARLVDRLLLETASANIPVAEGIPTQSKTPFSQARWAENGPPPKSHPAAVDFLLDQIRKNPGEITLVAIAPLTNIGAAIDRDPATFKKLKRVVLMGGSIRKGYDDLGYTPDRGPQPEYNIYSDVPAAQKLFASGVPIFMMPLDSTQLKLDEQMRSLLFRQGTPLTDALTLLYHEWGQQTPTLFDVMAVAYVLDPALCPVQQFQITVDKDGYTRTGTGAPNASACLCSDSDQFFHFVLPRLLQTFPLKR
ncbi:MAG: nucleoside hydrolase [Candidatus Acidiferrum sp.]|jgi:inosine-uridine nucleoside N-ribohydrolase